MNYPTLILIVSLVGFLALAVILWASCLWLGLKLVRAEQRRWPTIIKAAILVLVGTILINGLLLAMSDKLNPLLIGGLQLILVLGFSCSVLTTMFELGFLRAFGAWLMTLLSQAAIFCLAVYVFKPFIFEAFHTPTNSMAPTILGDHGTVDCPVCGKPAYGTMREHVATPVICEQFHISEQFDDLEGFQRGDHFLAAKFLQPKRWDMITFQWPEDPEIIYIKRLIGLPGETIVIREGSVWADGIKLEPPQELRGIKYYLEELPQHFGRQLYGSNNKPAKLGPDEYFVLGDFTAAAADSRYWQRGAPGHPPFAVPSANVTGVVTHTFWPWSRMRCFEKH